MGIYDAYLGHAHNNLQDFAETIKYLVSIWLNCYKVKTQLAIRINTKASYGYRSADIKKKIKQYILAQLPNDKLSFYIYVKQDSGRIFHARFLETDSRIFRCEPGFDFYDGNSFRQTSITIDNSARNLITKIRALREAR